jgi:hypothetical protein
MCHACERVLWNNEVLRKEEEHRRMHKRRECHCEVMFDAEERERRQRPRGNKGKGKGKEVARVDNHGVQGGVAGVQEVTGGHGVAGGPGVSGSPGIVGVADQGYGEQYTGMGTSPSMDEAGPSNIRGSWTPDARMAAYQYVGYHANGGENVQGLAQQRQGGGEQVNTGMDFLSMAQEYGYSAGGGDDRVDMKFVAEGNGFPVGGAIPREYLWEGQLELGQPGAGMKWYPQPTEANIPAVPDFHQPPVTTPTKMPRVWQRAMSEPLDKFNYSTSPLNTCAEPVAVAVAVAVPISNAEAQQPPIVSSDMANL